MARTPPVAAARTAAVWVALWVSTPMTTRTSSARMGMRSAPWPEGRGLVPVRLEHGRTVMGHTRLPRVVRLLYQASSPGRPVPATAGGQVLPEPSRQSGRGSHLLLPSPADHHRTTPAILTVRSAAILVSAVWFGPVRPGGMTARMTTKQAARMPYGPHGCAQGRKASQACRTGERERHGSLVAPPDERPAQASRCPRGHLCE